MTATILRFPSFLLADDGKGFWKDGKYHASADALMAFPSMSAGGLSIGTVVAIAKSSRSWRPEAVPLTIDLKHFEMRPLRLTHGAPGAG